MINLIDITGQSFLIRLVCKKIFQHKLNLKLLTKYIEPKEKEGDSRIHMRKREWEETGETKIEGNTSRE